MGNASANGRVDRILDLTTEPEWPEMDAAAYRGLAGDVVELLGPEVEADPVCVLVEFLAFFGCIAGRGPHVLAGAVPHHGRIWPLIVADSGHRKGQAHAEIRRLFEIVDADFVRARERGGLSSGEGLISALADKEDEPEADRRLVVVEEEFSRVLKVCSRDSNTLAEVLTQTWDGRDLRVMTKTPLVASDPHVSIISHIQPHVLRERLTETDQASGFANRFLFILVARVRELSEGGDVHMPTLNKLARRVHDTLARAYPRSRVTRSAEAKALWKHVYGGLFPEEDSLRAAMYARAQPTVLRLQLIYALLDGAEHIEPRHIESALAVWNYSAASIRFIFDDAIYGNRDLDKLYQAIRDAGGNGLDLTQQAAVFGRNKTREHLDALRSRLERSDKVERQIVLTRGRPREVWIAKE